MDGAARNRIPRRHPLPSPKQTLCAALAAGCFFTPTVAEARFGKSGGSSSSGGSRSSGSSSSSSGGSRSSGSGYSGWNSREHGSSSVSGGKSRVHDATPVGQGGDDSPDSGGNDGGGQGPRPRGPILTPGMAWISMSGAYVPYYRRYRPRPVTQEPEEENHPVMVRMGVDANALKEGGAVGFNLGIEERHWGVATHITALTLNTDDGSEGKDHIHLADVALTFSPIASENGRLRWEAGVAMARAPDITFIGPSLALSFERCLFGPFDVEGRLQWVPLPHLQLDGQAALAMHLGTLTLRAGWRGLLLDDRGHLDGVVHRDKLGGPFAGIGLHF
ncbi:MAG TPA: hypothetical protein VFZ09_06155 [Archangium sp.]|uniref:hypothetical protein n=1 Tax=Archangium sp. TaxID=1872627 RepID=UPI002E364547|nr:hypothetical protein [Archangium sp.]HEX5745805.1 hypothetical protein [Archangium sp.]